MIKSITKNFFLQNNASLDRVSITTYSKAEKIQIENALRHKNIPFHTFSGREDRKNTFVLKGLQGEWNETEIKDAIAQKGIVVNNINIMKNVKFLTYIAKR